MANRGACAFCGNERVLNARNLCTSCKNMEACTNHPDLLTAQRCKICRNPSCAFCILQGICVTCREEGRTLAKEGKLPKGKPVDTEGAAETRRRLAILIGVLAAAAGFNYWWFAGDKPSETSLCRERLLTVTEIITEHATKHGKAPASLVELAAAAKRTGKTLPVIVPATARAVPEAVVYTFDGKQYKLQATTTEGKPLVYHNKLLVMEAP